MIDVYGHGHILEISLALYRNKFWLELNGTRLDVPLSTLLWALRGDNQVAGVFTTHLTCLEREPDNWPSVQHLGPSHFPLGPWRLRVMDHAGEITTIGAAPDEAWATVQAVEVASLLRGVPLPLNPRLKTGAVSPGDLVARCP
jgi:hypothetical protein